MLNNKGFDLWAGDYDKSVGLSDEDNSYPFAGYKDLLNEIYNRVLSEKARKVLDIGFGTGTLTTKLYEAGCSIWGQDFSDKMIALAQAKMPEAELYCGDFSKGLVAELQEQKYDAVIATYSLHHLTDEEKVRFIRVLLELLEDGGSIYIGDVAFATRSDLEQCRRTCGDEWDEEEIYFVYEELAAYFEHISFTKISACAGIVELWK